MQSLQPEFFDLTNIQSNEEFVQHLNTKFDLRWCASETKTLTLYDSFEWNLWFSELLCWHDGATVYCGTISEFDLPKCQLAFSDKKLPRFWQDFPESEVQTILQKQLGLRALQPVLNLKVQSQKVEVKNEDEKTIARLQFESLSLPSKFDFTFKRCCLLPLRGYGREQEKVSHNLQDLGLTHSSGDVIAVCFQKAGIEPQKYSSKPALYFHHKQHAREVVQQLLVSLWQIARQNERGMIEDIDTEFLHDYRVSTRRIRSLLSQIKGIFPDEVQAKLNQGFKSLGSRTNQLRDLDVHLLEQDSMRAMLPTDLQPHLDFMFEKYQQERDSAQQELKEYFQSAEYESLVDELQSAFVGFQQYPPTKNSATPIGDLAHQKIKRCFKKIRQETEGFSSETTDPEIHEVRILCKKLRYLLEFFSSLFDPDRLTKLVKRLKALQDDLGLFNDRSVQQAGLLAFTQENPKLMADHPQLSIAIGALVGTLHTQHMQLRVQLIKDVDEFTDAETQQLIRELTQK